MVFTPLLSYIGSYRSTKVIIRKVIIKQYLIRKQNLNYFHYSYYLVTWVNSGKLLDTNVDIMVL